MRVGVEAVLVCVRVVVVPAEVVPVGVVRSTVPLVCLVFVALDESSPLPEPQPATSGATHSRASMRELRFTVRTRP